MEVLITITLLTVLVSCLILNTSNKNSRLDEGVVNIETIIRFSKSHSTITGKPIKLIFPESQSGDEGDALSQVYSNSTLAVLMDDRPIPTLQYYIDMINDSVNIELSTKSEIILYPDGDNETFVLKVSSTEEMDVRKFEIRVGEFSIKSKEESVIIDSE